MVRLAIRDSRVRVPRTFAEAARRKLFHRLDVHIAHLFTPLPFEQSHVLGVEYSMQQITCTNFVIDLLEMIAFLVIGGGIEWSMHAIWFAYMKENGRL
jgi:hypothetical protein